ncbi:MAG: hypothetical protein GC206_05825 [Alphaproteobacteria bacterium]|nr:hypothetical protein [Alphaproteobacteria bacterium]
MDVSSQFEPSADAAPPGPRAIAVRTFIKFQLAFWAVFLVIRAVAAAVYFPEALLGYMGPRLVLIASYLAATTLIHMAAVRQTAWSPAQRLVLVSLLCLLASYPLHLLELAFVPVMEVPRPTGGFFEYFAQFGWVMAAWAGYYFALDLLTQSRAQAEALKHARERAERAQIMMLRFQLNPHFMFNSLNAISTLVLEGRNRDAERMLIGLSRFLRHTIDTDATKLSRLEDEIRIQCLYLNIEAARFGDRLKIQCDTQDDIGDCLVPSLLLQPVVENAIKHGVARKSTPGWLRIASETESGRLRFIIEDDGPGLSDRTESAGGVGLRNTRERLAAIYGDAASMTIGPRSEGGVRVVFDLPLLRDQRSLAPAADAFAPP